MFLSMPSGKKSQCAERDYTSCKQTLQMDQLMNRQPSLFPLLETGLSSSQQGHFKKFLDFFSCFVLSFKYIRIRNIALEENNLVHILFYKQLLADCLLRTYLLCNPLFCEAGFSRLNTPSIPQWAKEVGTPQTYKYSQTAYGSGPISPTLNKCQCRWELYSQVHL